MTAFYQVDGIESRPVRTMADAILNTSQLPVNTPLPLSRGESAKYTFSACAESLYKLASM
ncbi:hypothetical protein [Pontibacter sp. H249]|uniref:hypothetical protein n=1 Tax=Pontibacter sp. H249 TaxID=3133420 RepID=UPI0030C30EB3